MSKNVGIFSPGSLLNYGGGEKWVINIGNLLKEKGYDVSVYTLNFISFTGSRVDMDSIKKQIRFNYTELPYKRSRLTPLKLKYVPNLSFDYVYIIGGYYNFLKQLITVEGLKTYGFHSPALQNPKNFLQKRILNNLIPLFDKVHILSRDQKKLVKNKNTYLLENTWLGAPVPFTEKFEKFTVLFFGRHEEIKGIHTVKYIAENVPESIDLIITGKGELSYLLNSIHRQNVKYSGFVNEDELSSLLSKSHLVLFPSYVEASSLVAVEAIAHHTPLIYRPIPQNSQLDKSEFNISASNDKEFLDAILYMEKSYRENKELYMKNCMDLPNLLMSKEEYLSLFVKYFLT